MGIVWTRRLKNNSTASVYNNGSDSSMSYNWSNGIFSWSWYIEIADSSEVIRTIWAMSAEVFVKVLGNASQFIFAGWEKWCFIIKINASNYIETLIKTSSTVTNTSTKNISDWLWHTVAVDYTGAKQITYVDWINVKENNQTGNTVYFNTTPWYFQFWANRQTWPTYSEKLTWWITEWVLHNSSNPPAYYKNRYCILKWFI